MMKYLVMVKETQEDSTIELNLSNSKNGEMTARIQLNLFVCGK